MTTTNVFMGNVELPRYPAGQPASAIYNTLIASYGRGTLVGPNALAVLNDSNPVLAGDYEYKLTTAIFREVTAGRDPPSKKAKVADDVQPPEKFPSTDSGSLLKSVNLTDAKERYFEKLLQPPEKLPVSDADLEKFLSLVPEKLPVASKATYAQVLDKKLVALEDSEVTRELAWTVEIIVRDLVDNAGYLSEAESSSDLSRATGGFLRFLNKYAPTERHLGRLDGFLDSANLTTSKYYAPLLHLRRPDYSLYVDNCLILRWENESKAEDWHAAMKENISKLRKWSPLYYGKLPYVIGGACAGRMFTWLRLFSTGDSLHSGIISPSYDLTTARGVVQLLLSTVRMHCLLQKLRKNLDGYRSLRLYDRRERRDGSTVDFFPEEVRKVVQLSNERFTQLESLYKAVDSSLYVIHQKSMKKTRIGTIILLHPVGYPEATPLDLKEVEDATHDILHGLSDLHRAGFTHRDVRWENIVKVPIEGKWKYVIIDLEEGGPDNQEWKGDKLLAWDTTTLDGGKRYTTRSDMYQFGKLLIEWLSEHYDGSKEERDKVSSWGKQMTKKLTTASTMLKSICKKGCERCCAFDKAGNPPPPLPRSVRKS